MARYKCPTCDSELEGRQTDFWCPKCKVDWADDEVIVETEREKPKSVSNVPWRDPKKPPQPKLF